MTAFGEDVLFLTLERVRAWEQLCDPDYCGKLDSEGLHRLLRRAGYSADYAQAAANQRGNDRLDAGLPA